MHPPHPRTFFFLKEGIFSPMWCTFGPMWCTFGALLVQFWCTFGALLVHILLKMRKHCFFPDFGSILCTFGALLVHFWCTLVHFWCTFGALSEKDSVCTFGALLVHFWCTFGALSETDSVFPFKCFWVGEIWCTLLVPHVCMIALLVCIPQLSGPNQSRPICLDQST